MQLFYYVTVDLLYLHKLHFADSTCFRALLVHFVHGLYPLSVFHHDLTDIGAQFVKIKSLVPVDSLLHKGYHFFQLYALHLHLVDLDDEPTEFHVVPLVYELCLLFQRVPLYKELFVFRKTLVLQRHYLIHCLHLRTVLCGAAPRHSRTIPRCSPV